MARNKESVVIIIDVGLGAEELTEKAVDCTIQLIKNKMFYHEKDVLSILLWRSADTTNSLNYKEPDQYMNIFQVLRESQPANWYMIKQLKNAIEKPKSHEGDWVDALIVAMGIVTEDETIHKTRNAKIIMFNDFTNKPPELEEEVILKLIELDLKLILVGHNIQYHMDDGHICPEFKKFPGKTSYQVDNEKLALQLFNDTQNTTLCNFSDALRIIHQKELRDPWTWNTTLSIGSKIVIHITGLIRIKEVSDVPKFRKIIKSQFGKVNREKRYFAGVEELDPMGFDLISGYMLGSSPIQFDPTLGTDVKNDTKRGVYMIGFVSEKNIPEEHFAGQSAYDLVPRKGMRVSIHLLSALVATMLEERLNILAWKVYQNNQKAKLVALLPRVNDGIHSLAMIELSYHNQHRFWEFPKLNTKKNQPTDEQLAAIDVLMDAMDLTDSTKGYGTFSNLVEKPLPFDFLPNIREQILLDYLENVVLKQSNEIPTKRPVKVPDDFQPAASLAVEQLRSKFPLKKNQITTKEKLQEHLKSTESAGDLTASTSSSVNEEEVKITHVGTVTPAEDFTILISHVINRMAYGPERAAKFHQYACQMRAVISDLLFKSMTKQYEKIEKALVAYRKLVIAANSSGDYNDWIKDIRQKLIERKMFDFWESVIVKHKLGPWVDGGDAESDVTFYDISKEIAAIAKTEIVAVDDDDVEALFDNM